jgi:hypothetical protein
VAFLPSPGWTTTDARLVGPEQYLVGFWRCFESHVSMISGARGGLACGNGFLSNESSGDASVAPAASNGLCFLGACFFQHRHDILFLFWTVPPST